MLLWCSNVREFCSYDVEFFCFYGGNSSAAVVGPISVPWKILFLGKFCSNVRYNFVHMLNVFVPIFKLAQVIQKRILTLV